MVFKTHTHAFSKRCLNLFSKGFSCSEIFFWIFVKNRKGARKVSRMQGCFENSNMQWEKSKKSRKAKWWKVNMRYVPIYLIKGSSCWVWRAGAFSCCDYHCSARPGELNEDDLATLRHTFFAHLLFDRVVVGTSGWGSGAPQSGLPSWACWITNLCSFLWRNLKNILSTWCRTGLLQIRHRS